MKRLNPETNEPFRRGDFNSETQMHFWTYHKKKLNKEGFYREHWLHKRPFERAVAAVNKARVEKQGLKNEGKLVGQKRLNPATGQPYKLGDHVAGDRYFVSCDLRVVDSEGYFRIQTATKERLHEKRITGMCSRLKRQSKAKDVPFNLTDKYLIEIFPKDFICPVLGIEMVWGDGEGKGPAMLSPSLDKLFPQKGYVKGNVHWMSMRANYIKQDASSEELAKVLVWLKSKGS